MSEDGRDSETLSGSQAPTVSGSPSPGPSSPPVIIFRPSLPVGEKFGGYRLLRPLGKGGMGEVYEAEQEETRRRVALKVLSRGLEDPTDRARFLREGRLAASVSHPNSVYIYGTEEIEGTAVIAMELVSGGTLKDRVERDGPMPPREAVDAILQVVEGLEAAAARGVLHRDVKPSNCFVSSDGGVKVGDYGLSMSTLSRAESHLTETGTFLGTPAFASPEQVRGDTIDVRSDIYSVGATLYYLVTGRAPFEGRGVGQLLSAVLERAPEPPRRLRPDVPRGLERVILQCLEKRPATRFPDYVTLRADLRPFGSAATTPATLGRRFAAAVIDHFVLYPPYVAVRAYQVPIGGVSPRDFAFQHPFLAASLIGGVLLVYFTLLEGLWDASVGKRIVGLRVVGPDGGVPRPPRAFLRTFVWLTFYGFAPMATMIATGLATAPARDVLSLLIWLPFLALLFATARRGNGFAGLHDLVSRTRVVGKPVEGRRPAASPGLPAPADGVYRRVGHYAVLETLSKGAVESLLLGYDEQLRRRVWIRVLPPGTPAVAAPRRDLARAGRLRWLDGHRTAEEAWDVYEAAEGSALCDAAARRPGWESVRFWLLDVAEELAAGEKDPTAPCELSLERVWITSDGRAKLLDFPAPSGRSALSPPMETAAAFLRQVCLLALRGSCPVYARSFVDELARGGDWNPERAARQLRTLLDRRPSVSSHRRVDHLILSGVLVICGGGGILAGIAASAQGQRSFNILLWIALIAGVTAATALLSAFLFRGGLLLGLLGMAVVTRDGVTASRGRAGLRSLAGWSPYWVVALACLGASRTRASQINPGLLATILVLGATLVAILAVWDAWSHPERGFQDRIAGTFLVPR